jgi:unsaturated chondroitin disaccharide hydrolase
MAGLGSGVNFVSAVSFDGTENKADLTRDGRVNLLDWSSWHENWQNPVSLSGDLNGDGVVDPNDFPLFFSNWLWQNPLRPVGHWKFDDLSGTTAANSSDNNNSGSLAGSPAWIDGRFSGALRFFDDEDAVQIPTSGMNASGGAISLWCNADAFNETRHFLFGHVGLVANNALQIYTDSAGNLKIDLGSLNAIDIGAQLDANTWTHISLVWDVDTYAFYLNGLPVAGGSHPGLNTLQSIADIGNSGNRPSVEQAFIGKIDDVRLYQTPLSDDMVLQVCLEGLTSFALEFAADQLTQTVATTSTTAYPRYTQSYNSWNSGNAAYWGSGFFPGCLWMMYEATGDNQFRTWAETWTAGLEGQATTSPLHDVSFQIFTSYGNGHRLTGNAGYPPVLQDAALNMSDLFHAPSGVITLGWGNWQSPSAIDAMMNLQLLFWAAKNGGLQAWHDMAVSHCYATATDLVRPDGGTYQIVDYDIVTGDIVVQEALQGYADESTWSRGQGWAVYGYTVAFRETGDPNFLNLAVATADYYIDNSPADGVAWWDFDTPDIPNTERDTSAGSVAASALIELSNLTDDPQLREKFNTAACRILLALCLPEQAGGYLAEDGNGSVLSPGLLMHGCHFHPDAAVEPGVARPDESLIWGDYYFLEALVRYKNGM